MSSRPPFIFERGPLFAAITHHNAIETDNGCIHGQCRQFAKMPWRGELPRARASGVADLLRQKASIETGDFVSLRRWLNEHYGSPQLRIFIMVSIRAGC